LNASQLQSWPKDFETELPVVPFGEFIDYSRYDAVSAAPAYVRKLPVLRGMFDPARIDFGRGAPMHVGWGLVQLGKSRALTFRLQIGHTTMYWLANAADQCVWQAIDRWAAAKTIVLAAEFCDGRVALVNRDFKMHPRYAAERAIVARADELTPAFSLEVAAMILRDEVKLMASSDIPHLRLKHVQSCVVSTERTKTIAVNVATGALAHNLARVRERMSGKGAVKH
jgi:hypothetical protein